MLVQKTSFGSVKIFWKFKWYCHRRDNFSTDTLILKFRNSGKRIRLLQSSCR